MLKLKIKWKSAFKQDCFYIIIINDKWTVPVLFYSFLFAPKYNSNKDPVGCIRRKR